MKPLHRAMTGAVLTAFSLAACTSTSPLSAIEALDDLDAIVKLQEVGGVRSLRYEEKVDRSAWYLRAPFFSPIRFLLRWTLPNRARETLDHPSASTRELLRTLPDKTGRDLLVCGAAGSRYAWLAELDQSPETRVLAIDGLAGVCRDLDLPLFAGSVEELCEPLSAERLDLALTGLRAAAPETRADREVSEPELVPYRDALAAITARPLEDWATRIILVDDLTRLLGAEHDDRARPWVIDALRAAIGHCTRGVLLRTVQGRDPQFAEVRLCAMQQIRGLGGPSMVPLLLASMAASPEERARGEPLFDPDSLIQLRLIHYCGQLDAEQAKAVVRLPGRQDWETSSPAEFLARTVLNEQSYYSKLRIPALIALTWCLGRKGVDADPAWVREWLEQQGG
ncbi:MAG: hypothetical protein H6835_13210 [Planctomycetes bacterium]|nr:hypothetical protein [Planctomycetota bacterium]